ncbi:hypothetical protein [Chondromyces apiculatus]|uniref:Uncharacterized protein n=1 Tax=Chondromyces apiculatus DSM 436 TaxID=1192034 RepID=A0A017T0K4_9BACT|nr:hypothetical protein [Chondromyces apiculatus]EYF02395.1 Hypothetical protein CAP_7166 [Chondromyces apiculatus DSM 436]
MANDPIKPEMGEVFIDARALEGFLTDLSEGAMRGMQTAQKGFDEVSQEIMANQAEYGDRAGITETDFDDFALASDRIAQIDVFLPAARKMVEIFEETRAMLDDQRQRAVHGFARSVEDRAKSRSDGELLMARYQKTRFYRSSVGIKALKTRRRNEQAAQEESETKPAMVD